MHELSTTTIDLEGHPTPLPVGGDPAAPALLWLHGEALSSGWGDLHYGLVERLAHLDRSICRKGATS